MAAITMPIMVAGSISLLASLRDNYIIARGA